MIQLSKIWAAWPYYHCMWYSVKLKAWKKLHFKSIEVLQRSEKRQVTGFTIYSQLRLTLIRLGGGGHDGPLDISRDNSATRKALATTLYDNFLSSFPHILTPNLWRFRS